MENIIAYQKHLITVDIEDSTYHEEDELSYFISSLDDPQFNGAFIKEYDSDTIENNVNQIESYFSTIIYPYQVWLTPEGDKEQVKSMLQEQNYRFMGESLGVGIELDKMNMKISYPKSLYIEAINSQERFLKWADIASIKLKLRGKNKDIYSKIFAGADFVNPDYYWRKYIGWLNGEPVVSSTLILAGGIAGIYDVALIPKIRSGIGIEEFIVLKPLHDAAKMGYKIGITLSTVGEIRKYMKLGFQEINKFPKFVKMKDKPQRR